MRSGLCHPRKDGTDTIPAWAEPLRRGQIGLHKDMSLIETDVQPPPFPWVSVKEVYS